MKIKIRFVAAMLAVASLYFSLQAMIPDEPIIKPADAQSAGGNVLFVPKGFCVLSATSLAVVTVASCPIPAGSNTAFIRSEQQVRWLDTGVAPTTSNGQIMNSTDAFGLLYTGNLSQLQFIATSTTGNVDINFYSGTAR